MKKLGILLIALPFLSTFLWAAFDFRWWTSSTEGQLFVLYVLHCAAIAVGVLLLLREGK